MKPRILFVDDDRFFTQQYVRKLENRYSVQHVRHAGEVMDHLARHDDIVLLVLDVMMPTPEGVANTATSDGMDTGMWLLFELRKILIERDLPVIVLTNREYTLVHEKVGGMNFPPGLVRICAKRRTRASDLPKVIRGHLENHLDTAAS